MVAGDRRGFTLVEALISLSISSVLVILVSTVFLVQNRYYSTQVQRAAVHDNTRVVTDIVAAELRSTMAGGVTLAENDSLTVRAPMVLAFVCATAGSSAYVQFEGGAADLDQAEVGGFGVLDDTTGVWSFMNATWSAIDGGAADAASRCATNGADTVGATAEFHQLVNLGAYYGSLPPAGTLLMLFRETTFAFRSSVMDSTVRGLFRGSYGQPLIELATGMDTTAQFQYRTTGSLYGNSVGPGGLANISYVRIVADARKPPVTGGDEDVTFGWSVNVPLGNAR